jgi:hypothetical protein
MGLALQTQRDLWAAGVTAKDRKRIKRVATPEPSKVEHLPPSRRNSFATPSRGLITPGEKRKSFTRLALVSNGGHTLKGLR